MRRARISTSSPSRSKGGDRPRPAALRYLLLAVSRALGNGLGMIVRRGFKQPPSYHIDRLRNAPVGHFYDVITNGYGAMLNYAAQIQPRDRWAIVAYIRALQYSQNANINDLPAEARARMPAARTGSVTGRRRRGSQPIAPPDPDFDDFPANPPHRRAFRARPARVRVSLRESARKKMTTTEQSYATTPAAERKAEEVPADRDVRRARFPGADRRGIISLPGAASSFCARIWWASSSGSERAWVACSADDAVSDGRGVGRDDPAAARSRHANALRHLAVVPAAADSGRRTVLVGRPGASGGQGIQAKNLYLNVPFLWIRW